MFTPLLLAGQPTGVHVLVKKGKVEVAVMVPLNPALHEQPTTTFVPVALIGQATGVQLWATKGDVVVALTMPLRPGRH